MSKPFVVAINAVSGGGKTSLALLVHQALPGSALFCFDDFDPTNVYPDDYYDWWVRGGNLEEFDCPGMRAAVDSEIARGTSCIVMDYPFGRDHSRFRDAIDLSVWVETPLDVAMARRILRDFMPHAGASAEEQLARLKEDMTHYLVKSRHVYLDARHKHTADLELDGWRPLEELRDQIVEAIRSALRSSHRLVDGRPDQSPGNRRQPEHP